MSNHTYIASPYSHSTPAIVEQRYKLALDYEVYLIKKLYLTYSPIVHCHHIAKAGGLPTDAAYWMSRNFAMLKSARSLHVLMLPGWDKSIGVSAEIAFWRAHSGFDPVFITPGTYEQLKSPISPEPEDPK